jgi:hypothetical protein
VGRQQPRLGARGPRQARHELYHARSTFPSDSFPGTLALATGGTPKSTGVYYDDSYDRTYYQSQDTNCTGPQGTEFIYAEPIDAGRSTAVVGSGGALTATV